MIEVIGQFDVALRTPIRVQLGFDPKSANPIQIVIQNAKVSVHPLTMTNPRLDDNGEYIDGPELTDLTVWIRSVAATKINTRGEYELLNSEQERFEGILIEATNRVLTSIRRVTGQWDLDTRRPIHSYRYKYESADQSVTTLFPLKADSRLKPRYYLETFSFPSMKEVTPEIWAASAFAAQQPIDVPPFEQFQYDAKIALNEVRFEEALIFSAFSVEQMLYITCDHLMKSQGNLSAAQSDKFLEHATLGPLLDKVTNLIPGLILNLKEVRNLIDNRNQIAHRKRTSISGHEAAEAIQTVATLKKELAPFLP